MRLTELSKLLLLLQGGDTLVHDRREDARHSENSSDNGAQLRSASMHEVSKISKTACFYVARNLAAANPSEEALSPRWCTFSGHTGSRPSLVIVKARWNRINDSQQSLASKMMIIRPQSTTTTHVGDKVVEGLLLLAELHHDGQNVVVQPHSWNLTNLLDAVRVHNVSAHKKLSITCLYSHTDMP